MRTIGDGSSGGAADLAARRGAGESHFVFAVSAAFLVLMAFLRPRSARSFTDRANEPFGPAPTGSLAKKSITPTPVLVDPAVNMPSVSSDAASSEARVARAMRDTSREKTDTDTHPRLSGWYTAKSRGGLGGGVTKG